MTTYKLEHVELTERQMRLLACDCADDVISEMRKERRLLLTIDFLRLVRDYAMGEADLDKINDAVPAIYEVASDYVAAAEIMLSWSYPTHQGVMDARGNALAIHTAISAAMNPKETVDLAAGVAGFRAHGRDSNRQKKYRQAHEKYLSWAVEYAKGVRS